MKDIPLTPERSGGLCIQSSSLIGADLIVSTTNAFASRVIRTGTFSGVSHAMLYIGAGMVIEAVGSGVRQVPLSTAFLDASLAVSYRRVDLIDRDRDAIIHFAKTKVGKGYDTAGALGAGVARNPVACAAAGVVVCVGSSFGLASDDDRFFCSELILSAFSAANRPIMNQRPSTSVPNDIPKAYSRGLLEYVGHLIS